MKITKHFSLEEFACKDGTSYPSDWIKERLKPLCEDLEVIREAFKGAPILVTSGYRTPSYNRRVGGVPKSQHVEGRAVDFKVKGIPARRVAKKIIQLREQRKIRMGGIGSYSSFTHYDQRGFQATWTGK